MRKVILPILKTTLLLIFALTLGQTINAQVQSTLCGKYEAIQSDNGLYTVNNNIWGSDAAQCIDYYGGAGFVVAKSDLSNENDVASYPFLGAGCHWGNCSDEGYGLPIPANEICSAPVHYKVNSFRPWGKYNVMIEGWLLPQGRTTDDGYAGGCEILIGLDYVGGMGPCGNSYGTFMGYEMYWCDWAGWNFVQFVKTGQSVADIDFKDFLNKSIEMGWCGADWNLHNMQAGFEIMKGGTGLATEEFTFSVETGTNCGVVDNCKDAPVNQVNTRVEAENFCLAGDVEVADCNGTSYVGWIDDLDWMVYKMNIPTAGEYTVTYSVASVNGGTIQLENQGGVPSYGTVQVPATGDWCSFSTVSHKVNLDAGEQSIAIAAPVGGWNIDWFEVSKGVDECVAVNVPARVEAENYCDASGVEVEPCSEGGSNVGWINAGDWMSYKINAPVAGTYAVNYRVASFSGEGAFNLEVNGANVGSKTMPNTGAWQNWETISHTVQLNAGEQDVVVKATAGGWNINWIEFTNDEPGFKLTITTTGNGSGTVTKSPDKVSYDNGDVVTLTAIAAAGSQFNGWSGDASGALATTIITMNGNKNVEANFSGESNNCDAPSAITTPFSFTGEGKQCWVTSDELGVINSWGLDKLEINGQDYTNAWADGAYPAKIDGKYYITLESTITWGHFEASGSGAKSAAGIDEFVTEFVVYPNPAQNSLYVQLMEQEKNATLKIIDMTGKVLMSQEVLEIQSIVDLSGFESGVYMIKVNNTTKRFMKK